MKNQQSLSRAIRRGNAVLYFNNITKSTEMIWKKGEPRVRWDFALRNRDTVGESFSLNNVVRPIDSKRILK